MTKSELSKDVISNFREKVGIDKDAPLTDGHVLQSSTLAVAMEHLGMIKDKEIQEYAKTRGGVGWKEFVTNIPRDLQRAISLREALDLLPA